MTRERRVPQHAPGVAPFWGALVPGAAQWVWGERERGGVFAGSFVAAVAASMFLWGTLMSLVLLGFAFAIHVAATVDFLRRRAFPEFSRNAVLSGAVFGLLLLYGPLLTLASLIAWPGSRADGAEGFLVNCWAYRHTSPRRDDLVWYRPTAQGNPSVGRVVAGQGQDVEWSEGVLRVDGRIVRRGGSASAMITSAPKILAFQVPDGHLLVRVDEDRRPPRSPVDGLVLVAREQVFGRAWAQWYPMHERRFL